MDRYTGPRGKGHCELAVAITSPDGDVLAVTPGMKVSATPRGGDSVTLSKELGQADKMSERLGFSRLFIGTPTVGILVVWDRGYIFIPHNINLDGNPIPVEWCRSNDVQCIWAFKCGEKCFTYNKELNVLEEVPYNEDKTLANNRWVLLKPYITEGGGDTHYLFGPNLP